MRKTIQDYLLAPSLIILILGVIQPVSAQGTVSPIPPLPPPQVGEQRSSFDGLWVGNVLFAKGEWQLQNQEVKKLITLSDKPAKLREPEQSWCRQNSWYIQGGADISEGSAIARQRLSRRRADQVAEALVKVGVARDHICAVPARQDVALPESNPQNSRADVELRCAPLPSSMLGKC